VCGGSREAGQHRKVKQLHGNSCDIHLPHKHVQISGCGVSREAGQHRKVKHLCLCGKCMSYEFPCKCFTFRCCPTSLNPPHPDICTCLCGMCMSHEFPCNCFTFRPHKHVQISGCGGSREAGQHRKVKQLHGNSCDIHIPHKHVQISGCGGFR
jgi:hypothetical protein